MMNKGKINSLQSIRAIAFLAIVATHCGVCQLGAWGVSLFVIMSGFLMVYTYADKEVNCNVIDNLKFAIKKISKLYPLHIITMILAMPFFVLNASGRWQAELLKQIAVNVFLLQAWIPSDVYYFSLNGVSWYISMCLILYFVFPWIMSWMKKVGTKKIIVVGIVMAILQSVLAYVAQIGLAGYGNYEDVCRWLAYIFPLFRIMDFYVGCVIGWIYMNNSMHFDRTLVGIFEMCGVALSVTAMYIFAYGKTVFGGEGMKHTSLYLFSSVILVYFIAQEQGMIGRILSKAKLLIWIGDISAVAYLIHAIVLRYINSGMYQLFGISLNRYVRFGLVTSITLVLSMMYKFAKDNYLKHKTI